MMSAGAPREKGRCGRPDDPHLSRMKIRRRRRRSSLPTMMAELTLSSWETIARRTLLAAQGRCSPSEYRRMVDEKLRAAAQSSLWLASHPGRLGAGALAPWHRRAVRNAKRLRRK
jgi:hypothetical protein